MQYQGSADGIVYWTTPRQVRKPLVNSMVCDHVDTVCIFCSDPRESVDAIPAQGDNNRPFGQ